MVTMELLGHGCMYEIIATFLFRSWRFEGVVGGFVEGIRNDSVAPQALIELEATSVISRSIFVPTIALLPLSTSARVVLPAVGNYISMKVAAELGGPRAVPRSYGRLVPPTTALERATDS